MQFQDFNEGQGRARWGEPLREKSVTYLSGMDQHTKGLPEIHSPLVPAKENGPWLPISHYLQSRCVWWASGSMNPGSEG